MEQLLFWHLILITILGSFSVFDKPQCPLCHTRLVVCYPSKQSILKIYLKKLTKPYSLEQFSEQIFVGKSKLSDPSKQFKQRFSSSYANEDSNYK